MCAVGNLALECEGNEGPSRFEAKAVVGGGPAGIPSLTTMEKYKPESPPSWLSSQKILTL